MISIHVWRKIKMNEILFDTNIIIDHLKGVSEATLLIQNSKQKKYILSCSVLSVTEILSGIQPKEAPLFERFLDNFVKIIVTDKIAVYAGLYMNTYMKSHGMNIADAIIAASAKCNGSKLYTLNIRHFPMRDIIVERPY
jgi:predicted nucleic acid-binding protein